MCQAIVKPAGVTVYRSALAQAWQDNPDSGGFAWLDGDTVKYKKGYRNFRAFWKDFREVMDKDVLIHFRLATHGSKCIENCHPFEVGDGCVMAHNGILSDYTYGEKNDRSDSRVFAEDIITPLIEKFGYRSVLDAGPAVELIDHIVGFSKLVFLTPSGFRIIGEHFGEWSAVSATGGKVWWSAGYPDGRQYGTKYVYGSTYDDLQGEDAPPYRGESSLMREAYDKWLKDREAFSGRLTVIDPHFDPETGAPRPVDGKFLLTAGDVNDPLEQAELEKLFDAKMKYDMESDLLDDDEAERLAILDQVRRDEGAEKELAARLANEQGWTAWGS